MILEHDSVIALTPEASRQGLLLGMRAPTVLSLAPACLMLERDRAAEQALEEQVAQIALHYTPSVFQYATHAVLLEVAASLRLFGGLHSIIQGLRRRCRSLQVQVQTSVAPTPTGAWLLATAPQSRTRYACQDKSLIRTLNRLPCSRLVAAQKHLAWLDAMGCQSIGALRALPRSGLQRRIGTALIKELDAAYCVEYLSLPTYQPPAYFAQHFDLHDRTVHTQLLIDATQTLIQGLCIWLLAKKNTVRSIRLTLHHERHKESSRISIIEMAFSEPSANPDVLIPLIRERLNRYSLISPVVGLTLHTKELAAPALTSHTLFPDPLQTPGEFRQLLDLLCSRIGSEHIFQPAPRADYRPEQANTWRTLNCDPLVVEPIIFNDANERPFWLLDTPKPLSVRQHRPYYRTPLSLLQGPERIENGWWDGRRIARDYFVAQDEQAVRYWIYRERESEHDSAQWFLHGLFG